MDKKDRRLYITMAVLLAIIGLPTICASSLLFYHIFIVKHCSPLVERALMFLPRRYFLRSCSWYLAHKTFALIDVMLYLSAGIFCLVYSYKIGIGIKEKHD